MRRAQAQQAAIGFRDWWDRWGKLLVGAWYIAVSVVLLWVSIAFYVSQRHAAEQARAACVRSQRFGPRTIDGYEQLHRKLHVFDEQMLREYRLLIPKDCK